MVPNSGQDGKATDLLPAFVESLAALAGSVAADQGASGGSWMVALSGGPDSVALCHLVCQARESGKGRPLLPDRVVALHVNHGLRGEESDRDQAFVKELAADLGLEYHHRRLHPPEEGPPGSLEAWAREQRYAAFVEEAAAFEAGAVLTGHHRNDQAETVIQRLARGAGFQGLSGIRPSRPLKRGSQVRLLRPLLPFTRTQIMDYLRGRAITYVTDRSNLDPAMQRNRIRMEVMPRLEKAFPQGDLLDALAAIADEAGAIQALLEEAAERALEWVAIRNGVAASRKKELFLPFPMAGGDRGTGGSNEPGSVRRPGSAGDPGSHGGPNSDGERGSLGKPGGAGDPSDASRPGSADRPEGSDLCLDRDRLSKVHPLVLQPLLKSAGYRVTGLDDPPLTRRAFEEACDLLRSGAPGAAVRFGSEWEFALVRHLAVVRRVKADLPREPSPSPLPLPVPGMATLPDGSRISAQVTESREEGEALMGSPNPLLEVLDGDRTGSRLAVRRRGQGDRFQPLGLSGKVKLKAFLIDLKVPQEDRDRLALVCNEKEILWVVGLRIHHAFRVTSATKRFLILEVKN